jgi:hypothetical protein
MKCMSALPHTPHHCVLAHCGPKSPKLWAKGAILLPHWLSWVYLCSHRRSAWWLKQLDLKERTRREEAAAAEQKSGVGTVCARTHTARARTHTARARTHTARAPTHTARARTHTARARTHTASAPTHTARAWTHKARAWTHTAPCRFMQKCEILMKAKKNHWVILFLKQKCKNIHESHS